MTLVDKYLNAVKEQLPRDQRADVIAELSDDLHSQIEDREAELGRPLDEAEQAAILKHIGNPLVVAARYRGDARSVSFGGRLIGPELFPTYLKVLTINVAITGLVMAVILLVGGGSLWSTVYGGFVPIFIQFAIVTGIFILADRRFARDPDAWDPRTMGSVDAALDHGSLDGIATQLLGRPQTSRVSIVTSLLDIGLLGIGLSLWLTIGQPTNVGIAAVPGPGWTSVYVPVTVLIVGGMIGAIITLFRPAWTRFRAVWRILYDTTFIVIAGYSLTLGDWVVATSESPTTPDFLNLISSINLAIRIGVAVAIVITALSLILEVRRLWQMRVA